MTRANAAIAFLLLAGLVTGLIACRSTSESVSRVEMQHLLNEVFPSVMRIEVVSPVYRGGRKFREQSTGSGAIISDSGLVVTNHHVAGKAEQILCRFTDGSVVPGKLVGTDAMTDIAVIQLDLSQRRAKTPLPVAVWGSSGDLQVGEPVFAMGCPGALAQSVTQGIIANTAFVMPGSSDGVRLDGASVGATVRWILHDAQIFGGNSGGPLVNRAGEIVGINELSYAGLSGAVPSDLARQVVRQLVDSGRVVRAWSGLFFQPLLSSMIDSGIQGALIGDILPNSPAATSGIKPGDILVTFDGHSVQGTLPEEIPQLNRLEMEMPVGKTVSLKVLRNGAVKEFKLILAERPADTLDIVAVGRWDMTAMDLTPRLCIEMQLPLDKGVLIHSSKVNGLLNNAEPRIVPSDIITAVNGTAITNLAQLGTVTDSLLAGATKEVSVLITLQRRDQSLISVVKFNPPEENAPQRAQRAWFPGSVQVLTRELVRYMNMGRQSGVRVTEIYPGRAAEKAGLRVGDILLSIDSERIETRREEDISLFTDMVRQYRIGSVANFDILRNGKRIAIPVTLDDPPLSDDADTFESEATGLTVRNLDFDEKIRCEKKQLPEGVRVTQVERGSPGAIAGMSSGVVVLSVNGAPTPDTDAFRALTEKAVSAGDKALTLFIRAGTRTLYYDVRLK